MNRLRLSRLSILAFAAGFSVITAGNAQAQSRPGLKHGNRNTVAVGARGLVDRKADLGLTDDQLHLLDVIARRYDDQDKLLRDDKSRAASRAAEQKEVNAILTDDQREKIRDPAPPAAPPAAGDQARKN